MTYLTYIPLKWVPHKRYFQEAMDFSEMVCIEVLYLRNTQHIIVAKIVFNYTFITKSYRRSDLVFPQNELLPHLSAVHPFVRVNLQISLLTRWQI